MKLTALLNKAEEYNASDLYLSTGAPPTLRLCGKLVPLDLPPLTKGETKVLAYSMLSKEQINTFESILELNLALSISNNSRFRANLCIQRGEVSIVIRRIQSEIPSLEALGLPPMLKELIMEKQGLILFVGATGCGKSTSLASLINYRNQNHHGHIVTIEDPIEFVHTHKKSIVNQREVGIDTLNYKTALQNTLRQSPDVILIGEIRSSDTMNHALNFSETGHLCLSTLHANNANQAFERIIHFFPKGKKNQLLLDLSINVKAIIAQRLIPSTDRQRVAAFEILLGTPMIASLIQRGEIHSIKEIMEKSSNVGMQTFDQSIEKLYFEKKINLHEALRHADSKNNLRLHIQITEKGEYLPPTHTLNLQPSEQNKPGTSPSDDLRLLDEE